MSTLRDIRGPSWLLQSWANHQSGVARMNVALITEVSKWFICDYIAAHYIVHVHARH